MSSGRWCKITDLRVSAAPVPGRGRDSRADFVVTATMEVSEDAAMFLQAAVGSPQTGDNLAANIGLERGGRIERAGGLPGERVVSSTGRSIIQAFASAAGVSLDATLEQLLDAVAELRRVAAPLYVAKAPPLCPTCRRCGSVTVVRQNRYTKSEFTACNAWPLCDWTYDTDPEVKRVRDRDGAAAARIEAAKPAYAKRKLEIE